RATGAVDYSNPWVPNAKGNAFRNGRIQAFGKGGIVGGPTFFGMSGGRTGLAGEAGTEGILPLQRMSNGDLGVQASGGGNVIVNIYAQRRGGQSSPVEFQHRQQGGMQFLDIFIRDTVKDMANNGDLDSVMGKNFGLGRRPVR